MSEDERVTESTDDPDLRNYLQRKSALSMGYRKAYVEAPPPELDQAVKARARRALRWLGPAAIAGLITFVLVGGLIFGVGKWMQAMVAAERNIKEIRKQQAAERLEEQRKQPVTVIIGPDTIDPSAPKDDAQKK